MPLSEAGRLVHSGAELMNTLHHAGGSIGMESHTWSSSQDRLSSKALLQGQSVAGERESSLTVLMKVRIGHS